MTNVARIRNGATPPHCWGKTVTGPTATKTGGASRAERGGPKFLKLMKEKFLASTSLVSNHEQRMKSIFSSSPQALAWFLLAMAASLFCALGCQAPMQSAPPAAGVPDVQTLREGDVIKITFPGTPVLDTTQQIRRDGRITLSLVGEVAAAGVLPTVLQEQLLQLYSAQLVNKQVMVSVVSSSFSVFVSGAVMKPGKIVTDKPITALEAVMEAGGFDQTKANLRAVVVIRNEDGKSRNYTLDLNKILNGTATEPFYLRPSDIVYVPDRFRWF